MALLVESSLRRVNRQTGGTRRHLSAVAMKALTSGHKKQSTQESWMAWHGIRTARASTDPAYMNKLEQQLRVTSAYNPVLVTELDEQQLLEAVSQEVAKDARLNSRGREDVGSPRIEVSVAEVMRSQQDEILSQRRQQQGSIDTEVMV